MNIRDPNGGDQLSAGFLDGLLGSAKANAVRAATNGVGVRQEASGQTISITEPRPFWAKLGGNANPYRLYPLTANAAGGDDVFSPGVGLTGIEVNGTAGLDNKIVLIEPVGGQNFFVYKRYGVWQPDNPWVCVSVGDQCCEFIGSNLSEATVTITDASNANVIATGTTNADGQYCFPIPWLVSRPVNWTIAKTGLGTATGTSTIPDASNGSPGYIQATLAPAAPYGCFRGCCKNLPIKGPLDLHLEGMVKHCRWSRYGDLNEFGSLGPQDLTMSYDGCVTYVSNPYTFATNWGPSWSTPLTIQLYKSVYSTGATPGTMLGTRLYLICANTAFESRPMLLIGEPDYRGIIWPGLILNIQTAINLTCSPFLATVGSYTSPNYSLPCPTGIFGNEGETWSWSGLYVRIAEAP